MICRERLPNNYKDNIFDSPLPENISQPRHTEKPYFNCLFHKECYEKWLNTTLNRKCPKCGIELALSNEEKDNIEERVRIENEKSGRLAAEELASEEYLRQQYGHHYGDEGGQYDDDDIDDIINYISNSSFSR